MNKSEIVASIFCVFLILLLLLINTTGQDQANIEYNVGEQVVIGQLKGTIIKDNGNDIYSVVFDDYKSIVQQYNKNDIEKITKKAKEQKTVSEQ